MEEKDFENQKKSPAIDFGQYSFGPNEFKNKPESGKFAITKFWARLNSKDKLYTTVGLIVIVVLIIVSVFYLTVKNGKQLPVTPTQYSPPVNYPEDSSVKYTLPLP